MFQFNLGLNLFKIKPNPSIFLRIWICSADPWLLPAAHLHGLCMEGHSGLLARDLPESPSGLKRHLYAVQSCKCLSSAYDEQLTVFSIK